MQDDKEARKELARLKRQASELAGQIHDIVEEHLWTHYRDLPGLSNRLIAAIEAAEHFKQQQGL